MPVFRLGSDLIFPSTALAEPDGLLAIGGDLSPARLLLAYAHGIFPWFNPGEPILWWSPMPRCVLLPGDLRVPRSLRQVLRRSSFQVTSDRDFRTVIRHCASSGDRARRGTWIGPEMITAYERLHALGHAHSVEVWSEGELAGGLYGVSLGRCFFGESMFHCQTNASKIALVALSCVLFNAGWRMIDMQLPTPHLCSLGGRLLQRDEFEAKLCPGGGLSTGHDFPVLSGPIPFEQYV